MQNRVLKAAVLSLLQSGPQQVSFDKREVSAWWQATARDFSAAWSAELFPWLWGTVDQQDENVARLGWRRALRIMAERAFADAIARYPSRGGRRYRARVRAEGLFRGKMFKFFPELKEIRHDAASNG